jgi:U32 family peptidase
MVTSDARREERPMKILAPVNKPEEVEQIIGAGADELYCGVLPAEWKDRYTNIGSPNRREWTSANLPDFDAAEKTVRTAHARGIPVYLTMNAFYTEGQYELVLRQIRRARRIGFDAFIVADLGLLLALREEDPGAEIHISNNGTTFNSETVRFYKGLNASRIILPRHLMMDEIAELAGADKGVAFEVFIMNSGCKNIDGFCTFQHGVNEVIYPHVWDFLKKMHADGFLLRLMRKLPRALSSRIKNNFAGIDSACLLNYTVTPGNDAVSGSFNLLAGVDPCGACDIYRLAQIGIHSIKIVGRNYSTAKKVNDVRFLKALLRQLEQEPRMPEEDFRAQARAAYRNIYKTPCDDLCYRSGAPATGGGA